MCNNIDYFQAIVKLLGRVICVDSDVFGGQVGAIKQHLGAAASKLNPNVAKLFAEMRVRFLLVEFVRLTPFADLLIPDEYVHLAWMNGDTRISHGAQDTSPVWVGPCPCCLHQQRMADGPGHLHSLGPVPHLFNR